MDSFVHTAIGPVIGGDKDTYKVKTSQEIKKCLKFKQLTILIYIPRCPRHIYLATLAKLR